MKWILPRMYRLLFPLLRRNYANVRVWPAFGLLLSGVAFLLLYDRPSSASLWLGTFCIALLLLIPTVNWITSATEHVSTPLLLIAAIGLVRATPHLDTALVFCLWFGFVLTAAFFFKLSDLIYAALLPLWFLSTGVDIRVLFLLLLTVSALGIAANASGGVLFNWASRWFGHGSFANSLRYRASRKPFSRKTLKSGFVTLCILTLMSIILTQSPGINPFSAETRLLALAAGLAIVRAVLGGGFLVGADSFPLVLPMCLLIALFIDITDRASAVSLGVLSLISVLGFLGPRKLLGDRLRLLSHLERYPVGQEHLRSDLRILKLILPSDSQVFLDGCNTPLMVMGAWRGLTDEPYTSIHVSQWSLSNLSDLNLAIASRNIVVLKSLPPGGFEIFPENQLIELGLTPVRVSTTCQVYLPPHLIPKRFNATA